MLRDSARCSRDIATALDRSVGSMSKPTSTMPSSIRRLTSYPASEKTASILRFWGSTSAVNRTRPWSWAIAARCSRSTEPMPLPW